MEKEIDCSYTDEIVCPHCGYEFNDSYEFFQHNNEDAEVQCYECDKEFIVGRYIDIKYNSYKKK
jgi:DNA-directed RNA polymerase subunit RPC12/RpoP